MNNEDELFMRCVQLDIKRYELEDKIQEILDYLLHTHITLEEFDDVQRIITGEETEYKRLNRNTPISDLTGGKVR